VPPRPGSRQRARASLLATLTRLTAGEDMPAQKGTGGGRRAFPLPGTTCVSQLPVHAVWLAGSRAVR
jgi:hypothetical protein